MAIRRVSASGSAPASEDNFEEVAQHWSVIGMHLVMQLVAHLHRKEVSLGGDDLMLPSVPLSGGPVCSHFRLAFVDARSHRTSTMQMDVGHAVAALA